MYNPFLCLPDAELLKDRIIESNHPTLEVLCHVRSRMQTMKKASKAQMGYVI
jgi:hypothetical protein